MARAPRVLIVDDSITTCLYMAEALQKAGYQVMTATDGREGLMRTLHERPDCLVLDVILPGMGGFEICRQIRTQEALRWLPIILVSTKNTPLDQAWGLRQGANRYLPKPFESEMLVQLVNEVIPRHMRPMAATLQHIARQQAAPAPNPQPYGLPYSLEKLVPRRHEESDVMWASNPGAVVIKDRQARRVHVLIDGRKNVGELCRATQMEMQEMLKCLRYLLAERHIKLYEPAGQEIDIKLFSR